MINDLAIARLAFAQSATSAGAQVMAATLRMQVEAAETDGEDRAAIGLPATAPVDQLVGSLESTAAHVDKSA